MRKAELKESFCSFLHLKLLASKRNGLREMVLKKTIPSSLHQMGWGNVSERGAESFSKSGELSSVPFPMKKRRDSNVEGADMQKVKPAC